MCGIGFVWYCNVCDIISMKSLVIKHSGKHEKYNQPWELVIRQFDGIEVDYEHVCYLTDEKALELVEITNNVIYWLYGPPDWEARHRERELEKVHQLREEADKLLASIPPKQRNLGE